MRLSVIICTKDRPNELAALLHSLSRQSRLPDELLIVNGGRPLPQEPFERFCGTTQVVLAESAPGLTLQRNCGLEHCSGDLIFFLDDDVVLHEHCLAALEASASRESGALLEVLQPQVIDAPQVSETSPRHPIRRGVLSAVCRVFLLPTNGRGRLKKSGFAACPVQVKDERLVDVICGCGFALNHLLAERIRFDEHLRDYAYMEDIDFSRQAAALGARMRTVPGAVLWHRRSAAPRADGPRLGQMRVRNHAYLHTKHAKGSLLEALAFGWSLVGLMLVPLIQGSRAEMKGTLHEMRSQLLDRH